MIHLWYLILTKNDFVLPVIPIPWKFVVNLFLDKYQENVNIYWMQLPQNFFAKMIQFL